MFSYPTEYRNAVHDAECPYGHQALLKKIYCKSTNFGGYKIWRFSKQSDLAAIKFGVSPSMQCMINVRSRILATNISENTQFAKFAKYIAHQNLLIYSNYNSVGFTIYSYGIGTHFYSVPPPQVELGHVAYTGNGFMPISESQNSFFSKK